MEVLLEDILHEFDDHFTFLDADCFQTAWVEGFYYSEYGYTLQLVYLVFDLKQGESAATLQRTFEQILQIQIRVVVVERLL